MNELGNKGIESKYLKISIHSLGAGNEDPLWVPAHRCLDFPLFSPFSLGFLFFPAPDTHSTHLHLLGNP